MQVGHAFHHHRSGEGGVALLVVIPRHVDEALEAIRAGAVDPEVAEDHQDPFAADGGVSLQAEVALDHLELPVLPQVAVEAAGAHYFRGVEASEVGLAYAEDPLEELIRLVWHQGEFGSSLLMVALLPFRVMLSALAAPGPLPAGGAFGDGGGGAIGPALP